MHTEDFLQALSDGRFDIDELIRDTDPVMEALVDYAIDSYLGNFEGKATEKAIQIDKITRGLHHMIAKLEEDKTHTLEPCMV